MTAGAWTCISEQQSWIIHIQIWAQAKLPLWNSGCTTQAEHLNSDWERGFHFMSFSRTQWCPSSPTAWNGTALKLKGCTSKAKSSVLLTTRFSWVSGGGYSHIFFYFSRGYSHIFFFNCQFLHWVSSTFCNYAISKNSGKKSQFCCWQKKKKKVSIVLHPVMSLFPMEVQRWLIQSRDIAQRFPIHQPGIEKMDGRFFLKTC